MKEEGNKQFESLIKDLESLYDKFETSTGLLFEEKMKTMAKSKSHLVVTGAKGCSDLTDFLDLNIRIVGIRNKSGILVKAKNQT